MTIRSEFKTYNVSGVQVIKEDPPVVFQSEDFAAGLLNEVNPENLPPNALQNVKNVIYIKNQLLRRNGLNPYPVTKPDSKKVIDIIAFPQASTGVGIYRFTPNTINRATSTGWIALTGPALAGTINDPISFTVVDERGFFSNNGANVIQEILPTSNTYAVLGNAPKYKYISSAFNRVLGANRRDNTDVPFEVGWCGDLNYGEWNPITDISAGSTPLVNSPADLTDDITGLFNLDSALCIIRTRSIWFATNNPSATNPFNFFVQIPRIGSDCPDSIVLSDKGLIFYNFEKATLYLYQPGAYNAVPESISDGIQRLLKSSITSPLDLFGSYNSDSHIYSLFTSSPNSQIVKEFAFNFDSKNWSYCEYNNVSTVNDIDYSSSDLSINDLTGTIAGLAGTIDSLGGLVSNANRFFGFNDGVISTQPLFPVDKNFINDIIPTDNGSVFSTIIDFPPFKQNGMELIFNLLTIQYTPYSTGELLVYYSKDNGLTWVQFRSIEVDSTMLYQSQIKLIKKPTRGRKLTYRISSTNCMFSLDKYRSEAVISGVATK